MNAQILCALPRCVEPASWQDRDTVAQRGLREGGPIAVRQAYPEGLPSPYRRHFPVGKMPGQLRAQMIVASFALHRPLLGQRLEAGQKVGGGELSRGGPPEGVGGEQPREAGGWWARGADPSGAQPS